MARRRTKEKKKLFTIILFIIFFLCTFIYNNIDVDNETKKVSEKYENVYINEENNSVVQLDGEMLEIHFLDVGQADSILICQGDNTMLIDAGNDENGNQIIEYLKNKNISDIDYVVGTHAHADHIGGMDKIVDCFPIGKIYFPKQIATTKNYEEFVLSVKEKQMKLTVPSVGEQFYLGNAICTILSPEQTEYDEENNYSIVLKITYGNTSYLFMGDAETDIENYLLESEFDISADILKVGHHGSKTSSSESFLKAVNPKYAIISVGKENDYNLPAEKIINRINKLNIKILRTDLLGTIIMKSDGQNIIFD